MARQWADMTDLEREARSPAFRRLIKQELGCKCGNCGSEEMVEYHHVVPLSMGGTNNLSNIVPLCYACHKAAHNSRHIQRFADHSRSDDGRPSKCDDETAFKALDLLLAGEIGNRKCKELMNLKSSTHPNATKQYEKWIALRGIRKMRNSVDVTATISPWKLENGHPVGWCEYESGRKVWIYYRDTGLNDVVYDYPHIEGCPSMTLAELWKSEYAPFDKIGRAGREMVLGA